MNSLCITVDYILLDPEEKVRLSISTVPKLFPSFVIRAPVPWSENYQETHSWLKENLYTLNPLLLHIQTLWMNRSGSQIPSSSVHHVIHHTSYHNHLMSVCFSAASPLWGLCTWTIFSPFLFLSCRLNLRHWWAPSAKEPKKHCLTRKSHSIYLCCIKAQKSVCVVLFVV